MGGPTRSSAARSAPSRRTRGRSAGQAAAEPSATPTLSRSTSLEYEILTTGRELLDGVSRVVAAIPQASGGPQELASHLGLDKVLTSRLLRVVKAADPMAAIHRAPGPAPLRRFLKSAAKLGVDAALIETAQSAVARFENLITKEMGHRSALDTVVAAWLPDARREFQLRRQQAAYRAMSQLKGAEARTIVATVFIAPAADESTLDVAWLSGLIGLQRIRPGAPVKLATRKMTPVGSDRHPRTLDDHPITDPESARLAEFCSQPLPPLVIRQTGNVVQYTLGEVGAGAAMNSPADLMFGEINRSEIPRRVPAGSGRKAYMFAEASIPATCMQFDVLVHRDVYPGSNASLRLYDTAFEGVASVNDRVRDIDCLDVLETVQELGYTAHRLGSGDVPHYAEMLRHTFDKLQWNAEAFRVYRIRIEYPIYGTQVTAVFDPPEA